ncbi:hypothetical protein Bbelb_378980 [Branchiostoma belcheri]|nr:hypothetical protein Bbelb_378980 [Branchiostoma belcheri]
MLQISTTVNPVEPIHHMVVNDRCETGQHVAVHNVLSDILGMSNLSVRVFASIFWDSKGVIKIDYLRRGLSINGEYYSTELRQLKTTVKEKRRGKHRAVVLTMYLSTEHRG